MLFVSVVLNYIDRANLAITASSVAGELRLDKEQMGLLLSAFGWSYALCQVPGGWLVDRLRPRTLFPIILASWSLGTVLCGFASSLALLFALRLAIGMLEAPAYPMNNRVATAWFPENERGRAQAFYLSGQFVGLAFLAPALAWLEQHYRWHAVFWATGSVGIVWALVWYVTYRDPLESKANAGELALIRDGGALVDAGTKASFAWSDLGVLLTSRKLWGVYAGQFAVSTSLWFFLTWFPTYLREARGIEFRGMTAAIPFIAAFLGVLAAGVLSDALVKRGRDVASARKVPVIIGLVLSTSILGANYVVSREAVIAFMALALFGVGLATVTWSLVSAIAPKRLVGLTSGVFNLIGNSAAVVTPLVVGHVVRGNDFSSAVLYVATIAALGVAAYVFVVGKIERLAA